jgi:hypothetical protein
MRLTAARHRIEPRLPRLDNRGLGHRGRTALAVTRSAAAADGSRVCKRRPDFEGDVALVHGNVGAFLPLSLFNLPPRDWASGRIIGKRFMK